MRKFSQVMSSLALGLALTLLSWIPLVHDLDEQHLRTWDESLFALRAYFLQTRGAFLDNFSQFGSEFEHFNNKPPLLTIIQALSFDALGYEPVALRAPIAMLSFMTVMVLFVYIARRYRKPLLAFFVGLTLLTSEGYISNHIVRTGDQDAGLVFLIVCAALLFFESVAGRVYNYRALAGCVLFLYLAFLVKTIAAFFVFPGFLAYLAYKRRLVDFIMQRQVWILACALIFGVCAYVIWNVFSYDGWFESILESQVTGRYFDAIGGYGGPFWYYIKYLLVWGFAYWGFALLGVVAATLPQTNDAIRDFTVFASLIVVGILSVISFSGTKFFWYVAPAYPFLSVAAGVGISIVVSGLGASLKLQDKPKEQLIFITLLVLALFAGPYKDVFLSIRDVPSYNDDERAANKLVAMTRSTDWEESEIEALVLGRTPFASLFRAVVLSEQEGHSVSVSRRVDHLSDDTVHLLCGRSTTEHYLSRFPERIPEGLGDGCFLTKPFNAGSLEQPQ